MGLNRGVTMKRTAVAFGGQLQKRQQIIQEIIPADRPKQGADMGMNTMSKPSAIRQPGTPEYRRQLEKLLFGPVLGDISAQVLVKQDSGEAVRYSRAVWHEWFKGRILKGKSTTRLPDDKLHLYILEVQAIAANDMGVTFTEKLSPKEPSGGRLVHHS